MTATCTGTGNCDYKTNGITLTINAPSSLVCDGSAKAATLSGYPASAPEGLAALPSIKYTPGGSTVPTTAGEYMAYFNWGQKTASVIFTLTAPGPVDPIANAPAAVTATYGQTLGELSLSNPQGNTPGTWAWADSTASVGDAGSHTFTANFTPNDTTNYHTASADVTVTVGKKAASVTADEKSKTYGEADPELTAVVSGTVGTDTINYTLSRAEGNNVGEYAISVTLGQNPNYDVTATGSKLTIGKKAATVTAEAKTKVYGSDDPVLTAAVTGTEGSDTLNYTLSRAEGNNVGEYAITVTLGQNPNYEVTATGSKLTINKKDATVTADNKSKTEGEANPRLTVTITGTVGDDQLRFGLNRARGEEPGTYAIIVSVYPDDNPNYNVTAYGGVFTVKPAPQPEPEPEPETEPEPQAPAEVTVPVSGDDATANVAVTVEHGVAAITDTGIDGVLTAKEVGTVTVDMSALETEITEVVIPSAMLTKVADAVADEANSADGLEVKLTEGAIHFDAEAVAAIREQAGDHDLHLKLDSVKEDELNKAQREAIRDMEVLAAYDAYMVLDVQRVEQISAGKATVTLKVELREGQNINGIRIFTVDENGELTEVTVTCEDGEAKFDVEAFSKYVVTYDAAKAAE